MWYHADWYGLVEYKLKVVLGATNRSDSLDFDRFFVIQHKHISAKDEVKELEDARKITSFCCIPKGVSKIRANF